MKKILLLVALFFSVNASYAATCPPADQVFVKRGGQYIPVPPPGWEFISNWTSHLNSDDVEFLLAAYGADLHPDKDADNHVRCYYGNPDLTVNHGVEIQTNAVIDESEITKHQEWRGKNHYYMCTDYNSHDVNACTFS